MEHILRNALLALIESDKATLLCINKMLTHSKYRNWILSHVTDSVVLDFWRSEYGEWPDRFRIEAIAPIQNKVGAMVSHPSLRHMLGQMSPKLDFRYLMDNGYVVIVDLSKGELGETAASLLGSLLVSGIQLAAHSRRPSEKGEPPRPFHLYIDELGSFATDSFASVVSEGRKFGLSLTMAHQYTQQLRDKVLAAIFGNVGSLISFRVGPDDAERLKYQFAPYPPEALVELDSFRALARPLVAGTPYQPMHLRTAPPLRDGYGRGEEAKERCRYKYAKPRPKIEERIRRLLSPETASRKPKPRGRTRNSAKRQVEITH
jgi:hypothetical protein